MVSIPKLDKSFIESLVKEPVENFTVGRGSNKGDNVAGDLYAIKVSTVSKKEFNLVYKVLPENNPEIKQWAIESRIFELEINLYTVVTDKVRELVKAHASPGAFLGSSASLPIPKYFGGVCDGENSFLILEDERPNGFRMCDKYVGYNLDEVNLILQELARYHAFSHFLIRYEGEKFFTCAPGLQQYAKGFWNDNTNAENLAMVEGMFSGAYLVALKLIEEKIGDSELATKVRNAIPVENVGKILRQTVSMTDREAFPTILHGDFWTNNILMKYDPATGAPIATKFIDFQQVRRGNVYEDLLYFLFTSTTVSFRKQHLQQVLCTYYNSFVDTLFKLGNCPCPPHFTLGNFVDGFNKGYLPIYLYMVFAIPLQLGVPEDDKQEIKSTDDGDTHAGADAPGWKFEKLYLSHPTAMQRLEEMTREFADLGYF